MSFDLHNARNPLKLLLKRYKASFISKKYCKRDAVESEVVANFLLTKTKTKNKNFQISSKSSSNKAICS